jgi:hypothetical protein
MIVHRCQQGTEQWLQLRAGIPTASAFDRILTPGGKPSRSAEKYMYQLLAERMMGRPVIQATRLWWADRGKELEAEARAFYQFTREAAIDLVGFITNDAGTVGASPDGLVGTKGLAEFKCPSEAEHVMYLLESGSAYEEYKVQVQGQLLIAADRDWVDVCSYHPLMPPALVRIERDERFIGLLDAAVTTFSLELERMSDLLIERGWIKPDWRSAIVTEKAEMPGGKKIEHLPPLEELLKLAGTP